MDKAIEALRTTQFKGTPCSPVSIDQANFQAQAFLCGPEIPLFLLGADLSSSQKDLGQNALRGTVSNLIDMLAAPPQIQRNGFHGGPKRK